MSLGTPAQLDDMEAYLLDIRHGRTPSPEFVKEIQSRYRQAGGRSPLLDIVKLQANALQARFQKKGESHFRVYVGMRHWHPYINSIVPQLLADGVETLISLPLTPYYSRMSTEAYHEKVRESLSSLNANPTTLFVGSWNDHPLLLESFSEKIEEGLSLFPNRETIHVLFTAHSLPERVLLEKDPYPDEFFETATLLAQKLRLSHWSYAYQSQGGSKEPWLGPTVEAQLETVKAQGATDVLLAPIGFLCDHMEILYDVDILFKKLAKEKGIRLERTPSLNASPKFIDTLEALVVESLKTTSLSHS